MLEKESIEQSIFKKHIINFDKLIPFGFKLENKTYKYSCSILNDKFVVNITIDLNSNVGGTIIEKDLNEEYTNFRDEQLFGSFALNVQQAYKEVLQKIVDKCTSSLYFSSLQADRLVKKIIEKYKEEPQFLFENYPDYGVLRCKDNDKWYSIIMNVDSKKLNLNKNEVFIINVRVEKNKAVDYIDNEHYFSAYHMNKKSWISILLDDSLTDDTILVYIERSRYIIKSGK